MLTLILYQLATIFPPDMTHLSRKLKRYSSIITGTMCLSSFLTSRRSYSASGPSPTSPLASDALTGPLEGEYCDTLSICCVAVGYWHATTLGETTTLSVTLCGCRNCRSDQLNIRISTRTRQSTSTLELVWASSWLGACIYYYYFW